jgi:nicotinamidase/pyrazinamidase
VRALIIVDVQNDFCPGGALAVPEGDRVVPLINRLQPHFDLVVATQDWHPPNHGSFAGSHEGKQPGDVVDLDGLEQILWPTHCVQNAAGAAFHPGLDQTRFARVFQKGTQPGIDSYSGFFDNGHRKATGLGDYLKGQSVTDVYVCGLATDYCVKFTAIDAVELGFAASVIDDACRGVDLKPGDVARAIEEMRSKGVRVVRASEIAG